MKRSSAPASASTRLVEPTSLTTQSGPAAASASPTVWQRADRSRDEHHVGVAHGSGARRRAALSIAPIASARASTCSSGS